MYTVLYYSYGYKMSRHQAHIIIRVGNKTNNEINTTNNNILGSNLFLRLYTFSE